MDTTKNALALVLAAALAAPALAQEAPRTTSGGVTVGAQHGTGIDDSSKLQQFETVPTGAFLPRAWFDWSKDDWALSFDARKLGLDDQSAALSFGRKDAFRLHLALDQNPNWMSNTARTPYTQVAPGVFRVPDGMQLALQNVFVPWVPGTASNPVGTGSAPANPTVAGFHAVEPWVTNASPIDLRYLRRTGRSTLEVEPGDDLRMKVSFARETRNGNKNMTFYGGPDFEIAAPVDFVTHDVRAEADFARGRVFANVSANLSQFTNDIPFLEVDNPERLELTSPLTGRSVVNDASTFRLWQAPDNDAWTVDASGGVTFPRRHKLTASMSTGRMTMSMGLLPISTNPNLATSATAPNPAFSVNPPYSSIEGRFDTFMGNVRFTGDPHAKFGYILSWRRYELTDKTEHYRFNSTVRGDVGPSYNAAGFGRESEGYATHSYKGEVHVLPANGLRLAASYGQDRREYDRREYADVTDHNLMFTADYTWSWAGLHAAWTVLDRKPGDHNDAAIPATWQGATQTDIAERKRHIVSGVFTVNPTARLSVSLTGQKQVNEFAESVTGLLDQGFESFGADLTFAPSEQVTLGAGYVYENYDFLMAAAYIPRLVSPPYDPANLWQNRTDDRIDTLRFNLLFRPKDSRFDLDAGVDYSRPKSDSRYDFALPGTPIGGLNEANGIFPANVPPVPGFPAFTYDAFPVVKKDFVVARVRLGYRLDDNLTLSGLYWYQKYDNVDWQTDLVQPYMGRVDPGSNRWFFLGARVPAYDVNVFRAELTYRF